MDSIVALSAVLVMCFIQLVVGECPSPQQLPVKYCEWCTRFMCAEVYEHSHPQKWLSCGGQNNPIWNGASRARIAGGTRWNGGPMDWWNDRVSSLVVRPECHLDAYEHSDFGGRHIRFDAGVQSHLYDHYWITGGWLSKKRRNWNDAISSWRCNCDFSNEPLQCKPREEWQERTKCTNKREGHMKCTYSMSEGMALGRSVTQGGSVSSTTEVSMSAVFKEVFTVGLKQSRTTTYDWSNSRSNVFTTIHKHQVACDVPVGRTVQLLQAVGICGDTTVYTGHYQCH